MTRASRLVLALMLIVPAAWALPGSRQPIVHAAQDTGVQADLQREIAPRTGVACPSDTTYSLTRPDPTAGPTVVGLAMFLQDIASLSDVDQTLDSDVYLMMRWRDPRLADPSRVEGSAECPVPAGRLWMPALEPENLRARQAFYPDRFLVDARGVVTLLRRLWMKIAYPLNFRDFPIDRHLWTITVWPAVARSDEVIFHPLPRMTGVNDRLSIQGWRVGSPRARASTVPRIQHAGTFARFDVEFELQRMWSYYAWKLGLPLTLIVLMAYGVYFIPSTAVPQQIGLGTTAMLTLIAYMLTIGSTLPKIAYLTRADRFIVGCVVLVFFGVVKAVMTLLLAQGPRANLIERVDRTGRWLYPVAVMVNLVLALFA